MKIRISTEDKQAVSELAWREHTTISGLIRKKVRQYMAGGVQSLNLPIVLKLGNMTDALYFIPNDEWTAAVKKAQSQGYELAALVRNSLVEDSKK
jgi:hypothetical protein